MRLIKYLFIFILLITAAMGGTWYYVTNKLTDEINSKYAGKKMFAMNVDKSKYYFSFEKATPAGFPYRVSWKFEGLKEEGIGAGTNSGSLITYTSPVECGYNLLTQKFFVSYDGEINAKYKPINRGFGSKLKIHDFLLNVNFPVGKTLFNLVKGMNDPVELFNNVGDINISTDRVEIFDLVDNKKVYDKPYEHLKITFVHAKKYTSVEDLMNNIPQHYTVNYKAETKPMDTAINRRLPASLFYGFSGLPSGAKINMSAKIDTLAKKHTEFRKGLKVKASGSFDSPYVSMPNLVLNYSGHEKIVSNFHIDSNSTIRLKEGAFDKLFQLYFLLVHNKIKNKYVGGEIKYIIENKAAFGFNELENSNYYFDLNMNASNDGKYNHYNVKNFSLKSDKSGIKMHQHAKISNNANHTIADGNLEIQNYIRLIDFFSPYVYRFGQFKLLDNEVKGFYTETTKELMKNISNNPKSDSKDLSFDFLYNSDNAQASKFGSVKISEIKDKFLEILYSKLLGKVGLNGRTMEELQKLIPGLKGDDKILQKLAPNLKSFDKKEIEKKVEKEVQKQVDKIEKEVEKVIPGQAKEVIDQVIPGGKVDKDLLNKLF